MKCKHTEFWFDRTYSYCHFCEKMEMANVCGECGKTDCEIENEGTHGKKLQPKTVPKKRNKKAKLSSSNAKRSNKVSKVSEADYLEEYEGEVGC